MSPAPDPTAEASAQAAAGADRPAEADPRWLLTAKVSIPQQVGDYLARESLDQAVGSLLDHAATVLMAATGFGKTTVLTELVRRASAKGATVAWLTLDAYDEPLVFGHYVSFAFARAGLVVDACDVHDASSASTVMHRMGLLFRAIENVPSPCVLVLDEVESVPPATVELVNQLLARIPRNLHVALALRRNPGLDLATHALRETMVVVGPDQLRFSRYEISRFFGGGLSRRELDRAEAHTTGWPIAVKLCRDEWSDSGRLRYFGRDDLGTSFLGSRLIDGLSPADRAYLLDVSVFDWIEPTIVREVFGSSAPYERIAALPALRGLVQPIDSGGEIRRVHPLIRDYGRELLAETDRPRKRLLHAAIARALARRNDFPVACVHAASAEEPALFNEIVETVGVFGLWLRGGIALLVSTDRLAGVGVEEYPRIALVRCAVLRFSGRIKEAQVLFDAVERAIEKDERDDRPGCALTACLRASCWTAGSVGSNWRVWIGRC